MKLNRASLADAAGWRAAKVTLPKYDVAAMAAETAKNPIWVHFGAGNIFRGFIAVLQQRLLDSGAATRGIVAAETFDYGIVTDVYDPFDNLTMNVILNPDATTDREIIASVSEALRADSGDGAMMARLREIFAGSSLQMVSFTITEKGYALRRGDGTLFPSVEADMRAGPKAATHAMSVVTALLLTRYQSGAAPIAMVSMDNCSHNGEKLLSAVLELAGAWVENGFADGGFLAYLGNPEKVSFPWSMIDKITPRPDASVQASLEADGVENMAPIITEKGTFIAPFVNAERPQYLVVEDLFPNGRPPLEKAGVYFCDRETVNKAETMKVTTCLNPLHTAMSVYGCLLGYTRICAEMEDADIVALIRRLGYAEGLPVVVDPGILSPRAFIDEVIERRLPNPFVPDAPQRIATDTSQKVGVRFGQTVKSYLAQGKDLKGLTALPLALAGWLRYLLGVDDLGNPMDCSADPMKAELQAQLAGVELGDPEGYRGQLRPILANPIIFGSDLTQTPLADKIEGFFLEELTGPGAVRATLHKYLSE